ncbi:MAG: hypothetical protein RLZZ618_2746 [Pseudomonadota bacterium]|jgi:LemA protein
MSATQIISCLVLAVLVFWAVGAYNRLVALRNAIGQAFIPVDTHLKRRHELIPQLADAARALAPNDADTLSAASAASAQAHAALELARVTPCASGPVSSLSMAEHVLDTTRARMLDALEASPELAADTALRDAAAELNATENRLAYARQVFNEAVATYNLAVRQFPTRLLSSLYGFGVAAPLHSTPPAAI